MARYEYKSLVVKETYPHGTPQPTDQVLTDVLAPLAAQGWRVIGSACQTGFARWFLLLEREAP